MKLLLNKIKSATKKKNTNTDKIKQLEIELITVEYANNPTKLEYELKEFKKFKLLMKVYTKKK